MNYGGYIMKTIREYKHDNATHYVSDSFGVFIFKIKTPQKKLIVQILEGITK